MLFNEPSPLETKVLTRRFGMPNSASIDTYLATDGYQAFLKAAKMKPEEIIEEVKISNLRGRGGAGFPTGMKWSFVPRTSPKPKYIVVQRATRASRAPARIGVLIENDPHQLIEGVLIAGLVGGRARGLHLHSRRVSLPDRSGGEGDRRGVRQGLARQEHPGHGFRFRSVHAHRRGRLRVRRGIGAAGIARRQARDSADPAAVSGGGGRVPVSHDPEQCGDVLRGAGDFARWRRGVRGARHSEVRRHAR